MVVKILVWLGELLGTGDMLAEEAAGLNGGPGVRVLGIGFSARCSECSGRPVHMEFGCCDLQA